MPTFEMDEAGKTTQVKSIFDSTPVGAEDTVQVEYLADGGETIHEHYWPTSLDGLGAAQPEEDV